MSEKVFTYKKKSENTAVYICDYEIVTTSLAYLRCVKLYETNLKTSNSGVEHFIIAKNVADVGAFGDVVIRLEYFDEGTLKTKLICVACIYTCIDLSTMNQLKLFDSLSDSIRRIKKILQHESFPSAASHSKTQSETASELGNFIFNCEISDCEFVLCYKSVSKNRHLSYETDKRFNIINEILGTESADSPSLKYELITTQFPISFDQLLQLRFDNYQVLNNLENVDKIITKEMQSLFQSSDSSFEMLCEYFKIAIKYHFINTCKALSEKSDFLQKFKKNYDLKSVSVEPIDPTFSTGKPATLHVAKATELHKATEQNQIKKMEEIIYHNRALLNTQDRDGKSALHIACEMDNSKAAECLLSYPDCLVDTADDCKRCALHYAAENGNVNILKLVLNREQNKQKLLNQRDVNGETALYLACKYGKNKVVEFILSYANMCYVNVGETTIKKCPIHCAAENGYVDIMKLLLNRCLALLNKQDKDGETALHLACAVGSFEVVEFLLANDNLNLDLTDKWDNTCFHNAALSKDCTILSALLSKKPDLLNRTNTKGRTALHIAASIRNDTVIEFLLNLENCDVKVKDINGDTPLHLYVNAYKRTHFDIRNTDINVFKQKCSSLVDKGNKDGDTPLHKAVQVADHESVKKLIDMCANKDMKNNNGQTPVDLAHKLVDSFEKISILSNWKVATNGDT